MAKPDKPLDQSSDSLYLAKLTFRPELRKTWLNFFVSNFRVVLLLIVLITMWGVSAFSKLPRESNPEVKIGIAIVSTAYPGASPSDVEELVTKKLETAFSGIKGIKKMTSTSANSFSLISIEFETNVDVDDSIRKLRDSAKSTEKDLPSEVLEPSVREVSFDDAPIWTISLTGPYDGLTLRDLAEDLQDELEKIPGVREVTLSGGDTREFEVAYDPQKLVSFGISTDQANQAIRATNLAFPAGTFEGDKYGYAVRSDSRFFDAPALARIPIFHTDTGGVVQLSDIATVTEKAIKRTIYSRLSKNGSVPGEAITLQVIKKTGGSIIDTVHEGKKRIDALLATFPKGITYATVVDQSKQIERDFDQLIHDFLMTIFLVFTILFLIVGLKEALVAGLAVPMTFFVTFGVMQMVGISLNFLSVLSLLLALGLLVDDAIVVVSATKQYLKTGKFTPEEAVLLVLNDFKVVLTTTTLTTVWAFLPLLMSTGIIGEFIKSIPITVSVILIASLLIALMVNHPLAAVLERIRMSRNIFFLLLLGISGLGYAFFVQQNWWGYLFFVAALAAIGYLLNWYFRRGGNKQLEENKILSEREWRDDELIKKKLREQGSHEDATLKDRLMHGIIHFNSILPWYEKWLRRVVATKKSRGITIALTVLLFAGTMALPAVGVVQMEFFPSSNQDSIFIDIQAPVGLTLSETDKIVQQVEQKLLAYSDIVSFSTIVGKQGTSGSGTNRVTNTTSHLANITVNLLEKEQRKAKSYDIATVLREDFSSIQEATVTVESLRGGPPAGADFEARISGEDLQTLDKIAHDLLPFLSGIPGVLNPDISLKPAPAEYSFALDPVKLELYNLNAAYVGSILRMAISGTEVTKVVRDGQEIKVIATFDSASIPTLQTIQNLQILNLARQPVYIRDILQTKVAPAVDAITRIDQKRVVLLSASVDTTTKPAAVVAEFQKRVAAEYTLPDAYTISFGGENESNNESVLSILNAMSVAALLIISTLIIQFNSFKKALIVLVTIPLALIGVFLGLALFHIPLSFPGLIGTLALFGIVVKNAIILIDKMNLNLKAGIPFAEAIIDAGKSRLEAIFITSVCTIAGLIPITLSNETWTALGGTIIFGLSLSSFLTLFIIPTLFRTFVGEQERF